jgi:hypothetical protein
MKTVQWMAEEPQEQQPVAALQLHFLRDAYTVEEDVQDQRLQKMAPAQLKLPTNELVCLLDMQDVAALESTMFAQERVLWTQKINQRKLGLFTMLIWCQGLGMIGVGHWVLFHLCGYIGECYTYLSPGVYWAIMIVFLAGVARFADSQYFQKRIASVENGHAFFLRRKSAGTSFGLSNGLVSKTYEESVPPCPITLVQCRWKHMGTSKGSSFIKIALFTMPKEQGLQIPVACDVIDTLRASFRTKGMAFMNYHGLLVASTVHMTLEAQQGLRTFLCKSGFCVLCNEREDGLLVAMKRMGGFGAWVLHMVQRWHTEDSNRVSVSLHFLSASDS